MLDSRLPIFSSPSNPGSHTTHRRPLSWAGVAGLLTFSVLAGCSERPAAPEPVRSVRTEVLQMASSPARLELPAEVRPRSEARLSFRVPGQLLSREVGLGERVRAGQVLARLDPKDLLLAQQAADAGVSAARTQYEQAAADQRRFADLLKQGFISPAEFDRRDAAFKAAEATLRQATAQANAQGNQARYATLVAGAAGVVTGVEADPGTVLSAGAGVVRVAYDGPRDVVFSVPEAAVGLVRTLQASRVSVEVRQADGRAGLAAPIREVAAAADPVTRTFQARADIGQKSPWAIGQILSVVVAAPAAAPALEVPMTAVFGQQGRSQVWVLDAATMTVKAQAVEIAGPGADPAPGQSPRLKVTTGLSPGQEIVTAGVHVLTPGQKVTRYVDPRRPGAAAAALPAASAPGAAASAASAARADSVASAARP